ncbi:unnamed protein product [Larinioides sclopetarius]|uniref:Uncharacterized protein n=1 Tax=Larinioides sclopetarius TaxID=280406 RepID=A0AAV1ZXD4_9ARAC
MDGVLLTSTISSMEPPKSGTPGIHSVLASPDPKGVIRVTNEKISNGHNVHYGMTVDNIQILEAWSFANTYLTNCEVLPSSWSFEMAFHEMKHDGSVSFSLFLRRNYSWNSIGDAAFFRTTIWVSFTTSKGCPIFPPTVFTQDSMILGEEMIKSVQTNPPLSGMGESLCQELVLTISIMVRFCHLDG